MKRRFFIATLITLTFIGPAQAEKWAILVGIDHYEDPNITDLRCAVADVTAFKEVLTDQKIGDFDHVYLMTDKHKGNDYPTHTNITFRFENLASRINPEDTFLFYFSGHGLEKGGRYYLLSVNSITRSQTNLKQTSIPLDVLEGLMKNIRARKILFILDACRNEPSKAKGGGDNIMSRGLMEKTVKVMPGKKKGVPGYSAVLFACKEKERAYEWDEKGHGVFTFYLLEGMKGEAANDEGDITVNELVKYTQDKVLSWCRDNLPDRIQTPTLKQYGVERVPLMRLIGELETLEEKRKVLEAELQKIQEQRRHATQEDDAVAEAEAKRREAELAEQIRQAKADEETERRRQERIKKQEEADAQQQHKQAQERERIRQEQAEIARLQNQVEQERRRKKVEEDAKMTIVDALNEVREIKAQIAKIRPQVEKEIEAQIEAIPEPQNVKITPKDEFEKQAAYNARVKKAQNQESKAKHRYNEEIASIRAKLDAEVAERKKGYEEALAVLDDREFILDETRMNLELGKYDAEAENFPDAIVKSKTQSPLDDFPFTFAIPIDFARQFKTSVINGTIKLHVTVALDADAETSEIKAVSVVDLVQDKTFGYPLPGGFVPSGGETEIAQTGQPYFRQKDGMKMVYIPAGTFTMGDETGDLNGTENWLKLEQHDVDVNAFHMDEHEVTNEQYCKFLNAISVKDDGKRWLDSSGNMLIYYDSSYCKIEKSGSKFKPESGYENHPVVCVYWHGANEYAKWVGGRLPTEAEWEKAARGGVAGRKYPNGNTISHDDANYKGTGGKDKWGGTAPVKSFAPNMYGLYDIAGNVYDWCSDYWDVDYYAKSPKDNPTGPSSGNYHVIRGGSWYNDANYIRCGFRLYYDDIGSYFFGVGFRVLVARGFFK